MDAKALLAPDTGPPLGPSRARILDLLRAEELPLGVREVADRTGLHQNTARFHLDALADAGLATREARPGPLRAGPAWPTGRPRTAARRAAALPPAGRDAHRLIAGVMPGPGEAAAEAGPPVGPLPHRAARPVSAARRRRGHRPADRDLAEIGFAPRGRGRWSRLSAPAAAVPVPRGGRGPSGRGVRAAPRPDAGRADQMRAPVTVDRLQPFAEPAPVHRAPERRSGAAAQVPSSRAPVTIGTATLADSSDDAGQVAARARRVGARQIRSARRDSRGRRLEERDGQYHAQPPEGHGGGGSPGRAASLHNCLRCKLIGRRS